MITLTSTRAHCFRHQPFSVTRVKECWTTSVPSLHWKKKTLTTGAVIYLSKHTSHGDRPGGEQGYPVVQTIPTILDYMTQAPPLRRTDEAIQRRMTPRSWDGGGLFGSLTVLKVDLEICFSWLVLSLAAACLEFLCWSSVIISNFIPPPSPGVGANIGNSVRA